MKRYAESPIFNTQIDGYSGIDLTISFNNDRFLVTSPATTGPFNFPANRYVDRFRRESLRRFLRMGNRPSGYSAAPAALLLNRLWQTLRKSVNYSALCQLIPKRVDILIDKSTVPSARNLVNTHPETCYDDKDYRSSHPYKQRGMSRKTVFIKRRAGGRKAIAVKKLRR